MGSRLQHAVLACVVFFLLTQIFAVLAAHDVHTVRVVLWSAMGIGSYVLLSHLFGFDPHRSTLHAAAAPMWHYIDRWELRSGQATLAMLGIVAATAGLFDAQHFVTAVVCGTLAAHVYFIMRLCVGAYGTH
jgi:hypothetical protein